MVHTEHTFTHVGKCCDTMQYSCLQDGVFMDEVMEVCVATMHLLARDVTCRAQLRQLNCVPLVVQVSNAFM